MEQKFYICKHGGNIAAMVKNADVPVMCCGRKMEEIVPGTAAAVERHVPVYQTEGGRVSVAVGSAEHSMLPGHCAEWSPGRAAGEGACVPAAGRRPASPSARETGGRPSMPAAACAASGRHR